MYVYVLYRETFSESYGEPITKEIVDIYKHSADADARRLDIEHEEELRGWHADAVYYVQQYELR